MTAESTARCARIPPKARHLWPMLARCWGPSHAGGACRAASQCGLRPASAHGCIIGTSSSVTRKMRTQCCPTDPRRLEVHQGDHALNRRHRLPQRIHRCRRGGLDPRRFSGRGRPPTDLPATGTGTSPHLRSRSLIGGLKAGFPISEPVCKRARQALACAGGPV